MRQQIQTLSRYDLKGARSCLDGDGVDTAAAAAAAAAADADADARAAAANTPPKTPGHDQTALLQQPEGWRLFG